MYFRARRGRFLISKYIAKKTISKRLKIFTKKNVLKFKIVCNATFVRSLICQDIMLLSPDYWSPVLRKSIIL